MSNDINIPDVVYISRESDKPNDVKVWGMEVHNSIKYVRADRQVPSEVVEALKMAEKFIGDRKGSTSNEDYEVYCRVREALALLTDKEK